MSENTKASTDKLLGFLGLCRKAGKLVLGTPMVCEELRGKRKPALVVASAGASAPTKKRLATKCAFYGVPLREVPVAPDLLAHAVGKSGNLAAVAVTDPKMADALSERISLLSPSPSGDAGILISTGKEA